MKKAIHSLNRKNSSLNTTRIIALVFAAIILLGTLLLSLPVASRDGQSCGFLPALFTATSATCVTGLVMFDTVTQWSGFGQIVILCLIEIGGLGFMSAASLAIFLLRKKVGLRQRMVMAQAMSVNDLASVVRLQKWVLGGSLAIQFSGALILFIHFLPEYGILRALRFGVFHAVSAFCNAGFDIFGFLGAGQSMIPFQSDPVVLITLMALISLGGLGFFVWEEVIRVRRFKKFTVYTKLVLITTFLLTLFGTAGTALLEWNNPQTLGNLPVQDKILGCFFQSVTLRTAGFDALGQGFLTQGGKALSIVLMLIGGSSGSTAGGLKTVTFVVLLLFVWSRIRGKTQLHIFRRSVPVEKAMDAMTIATVITGLAFFGATFLCINSGVPFLDALFEAYSALATVGLTAGITPSLAIPSQLLIILFMYFGRVGILTISLGFLMGDRAEERFQYANTHLLIG